MPPRLYQLLERSIADHDNIEPQWVDILQESSDIDAAGYVHPQTKLTPLHLAVMAKATKNNRARVGAIRSLLLSNLTATEVHCEALGYTPLMYACLVEKNLEQLEKEVPAVKLLLEYNRRCFHLRSNEGHSALDIHIISMSRWKQESCNDTNTNGNNCGSKGPNCTLLLKALVDFDLGISVPRSLDLLFSCNSLEILEHVAEEEAQALAGRLKDRRKQRKQKGPIPIPSGSRKLQNFWIWEFVLTILRSEHEHTYRDIKPVPPFNALHTASQIDDFPLPFMMLCMRAYPAQVRTPSIVKSDLPIHSIARWETPVSAEARKSMTLTQLISEHPSSSKIENRDGKTPLDLAMETGATWDSCIKRLTVAQDQTSAVKRRVPDGQN